MTDFDHPTHGTPTLLDDSGAVLVSSTSVQKKSPWGLRIGLLAATAAVAGAGVFAVKTALSEPAGAQSPEEAVTQLFEALGNEDILGMTETLLPSERESLVEPGLAIFAQLQRLEIVDAEADLGQMQYFNVTIEGLELTSTPVTEGLALVETTGGTISASGSGAVPLADRFEPDSEAWTEGPTPMADDPLTIAVVEENGSWYVSRWYSGAEAARTDAGITELPLVGGGPAALDAEGVLTLFDPEEARVLYDYSNLYLPRIEEAIGRMEAELDASGTVWSVDRLEVGSLEWNGRTVVDLTAVELSLTGPDVEMRLAVAEGCGTTTINGEAEEWCADEVLGSDPWKFQITVVERDGRWYLSLMPAVLYSINDALIELQPSDIDPFIESFDDLTSSLLGLGMMGVGQEESFEFESGQDSGIETDHPSDPAVVPPGAQSWGRIPSSSTSASPATSTSRGRSPPRSTVPKAASSPLSPCRTPVTSSPTSPTHATPGATSSWIPRLFLPGCRSARRSSTVSMDS
ncbi:MAG: hypothetical protein O3C27_07320 [Actinomycetota bacterium]|nr:hypothetical protein [Actinomycetota bacterium]